MEKLEGQKPDDHVLDIQDGTIDIGEILGRIDRRMEGSKNG